MRPIVLQGHTRSLTQIKFNVDGDLLFSVSKDHVVNAWYAHNGERLGTYEGHNGALWTLDVTADSQLMASGGADNTMRLWNVQTGACLQVWEFPTAVKRVEFSEDDTAILAVTEERMGHVGTVTVFPIVNSVTEKQATEPSLVIPSSGSKATVAGWSIVDKYIITGHEDGSISQYDAKSGELLKREKHHESHVTDIQFAPDRTYFITSSKDWTAKLTHAETLSLIKTFRADSPLNSAAITPNKDFIIVGGGQEARDVTTTAARQGRFEARIYHVIFEEELGRVRGHFGPLNTIAIHPQGTGYASGGEDGLIRLQYFDKDYFDFA